MATATYPGAGGITATTELGVFIPELWSDEIIGTYKSNLVAAPLVVTMDHVGKKGDTVHIPTPTRESANAKAETTAVTIIANTEGNKTFTINQHFEYSRLIEDFAKVQAIDTYRSFYTDDAGYALSKLVDTNILREGAGFGDSNFVQWSQATNPEHWDTAYVGNDGTTLYDNATTGNASTLTDAAIRRSLQRLDDDDVPSARRVMIVPPVEKSNILGGIGTSNDLRTYSQYSSTGEAGSANQIRSGLIADIYGVPVYVSTNAPIVDDDNGDLDQRAVLIFQKEALTLFEQQRPRTQTQYKQEYLADLFTADIIFDTGVLRPEGGVALIVPE